MAMVTVINKTKHAFDLHGEGGRGKGKHLRFEPGRNQVDADDLHDVLDHHDENVVVRSWFESGDLQIVDERRAPPEQEPSGSDDGGGETKPAA